jgi:hypothetical protein
MRLGAQALPSLFVDACFFGKLVKVRKPNRFAVFELTDTPWPEFACREGQVEFISFCRPAVRQKSRCAVFREHGHRTTVDLKKFGKPPQPLIDFVVDCCRRNIHKTG